MCAGLLVAHPMGKFSVSHYSRIEPGADGVHIRYVLDFGEVPTLELLQQWKVEGREAAERRAVEEAGVWVRNLKIESGRHSVMPQFESASAAYENGTLRVTSDVRVAAVGGQFTYEDTNFSDRAGWKEIVIAPSGADRSKELTAYPADAMVSAPQDVKVSVGAPAQAPPRDDLLARLLHRSDLGLAAMLVGLAVAFGLGAIHALSPGHGKTIVAAYLVGARGTAKHALFLGGMVTFTHTISVFFLGLATLFLSRFVLPERIYPVLGAISGLSIVWIGATLFFKRLRSAKHPRPVSNPLVHDHGDGHIHSHVPEGDVTMSSLIALGASGGLVPCPSALVLLLSSVALGRVALGLTLLVAFSAGLAVVLSGIGLVVLFAKHLLPDPKGAAGSAAFRYLPVASAAIITCAGIVMTGVALGVIRPFA